MSDKNFKACETCKSTDCPSYAEMMSIGGGDIPRNAYGKKGCNGRCPLGMDCTLEEGHDLPHISVTKSGRTVAMWNAGYWGD